MITTFVVGVIFLLLILVMVSLSSGEIVWSPPASSSAASCGVCSAVPASLLKFGAGLPKATATAGQVCSSCENQPGYEYRDGTVMIGATELPTTNAVPNKIHAQPNEILSKCMHGGQIDSNTLVPTVGCNQTAQCVGIAYDTTQNVCTLLGGYKGTDQSTASDTVSTYLKNCSCTGGGDTADISCGSNVYGSQQCPTGTCYGDSTSTDSMSAYCCMDASGGEAAGCSVTANGLTSGIFVPYMFYGASNDNFSDSSGCVVDGTCPVISFSPVGSYNVNVYVNTYTAYTTRLTDPTAEKAARKVAECRLENISCQNDCVTEIGYIVGFPDDVYSEAAQCPHIATSPGNSLADRTPDTLLLIKGRLYSSLASTDADTLGCAPMFSQDSILARLMTNSNRTDWITLFYRDTVLQTFLKDSRFGPTTKFYWHPGYITEDGTPMGIQTSDGVYSTVWVDPAALGNTVTYCQPAIGSSMLFTDNTKMILTGMAPACTVPFIAGCRTYTNPAGYFIPGGVDSGSWHSVQGSSNSGYSIQPTVYSTSTLEQVATSTQYTIPTNDAVDGHYCFENDDNDTTKASVEGLCGTTCTLTSADDDTVGLKSGFCQDLDAQAGDSQCAIALSQVIGDTQYYDAARTWCMRDDNNTLGLSGVTNPCFVNDVRKVMSGSAGDAVSYGLQYGGSTTCTPGS